MKYLILITSNPAVSAHFAGLSDAERAVEFQAYFDIESDLEASGELVDSKAVDGDTQLVVTRGAEGPVVTPAPAGEADVATGYYLVDVVDEARAVAIAARFPEAAVAGGGVRVTRVWTQDDFDAAMG